MEKNITGDVSKIAQEFERLLGQPCYFLSKDDLGNIVHKLCEGNCPDFCFEISKCPVGVYLCERKRQKMIEDAFSRAEPIFSVCHAGLYEIIVPAFSGSSAIGAFNVCFKPKKLAIHINEQKEFYQQKYDCDIQVMLQKLDQIQTIDENILQSTANLLNGLVLLKYQPDLKPGKENKNMVIDSEDFLEFTTSTPMSIVPRSLSQSIELNKDDQQAYQGLIDILDRSFNIVYLDIRTGRLVKAKERFKSLFNGAYFETELKKQKLSAQFYIFRFNDCLLRKISHMKEIYELNLQITERIYASGDSNEIRGYINDYFDAIVQIYGIKGKQKNFIINRIVSYIDVNFDQPFTIKDMVKSMNVSASYASRMFNKQMGVSIKWYINEIRMYHAQHLLRYTDWPVSMVASRVGYTDVRSFYKMFEKHFGISCTKMRNLYTAQYEKIKEKKNENAPR